MGMVKVVPKKVNGKTNWNASFEYRDKLVAEGKLPYNKDDHERAKASKEKYNGIPWFILYENEVQHFITSILKGDTPQPDIKDTLKTMYLQEAFIKSINSEKPIKVFCPQEK